MFFAKIEIHEQLEYLQKKRFLLRFKAFSIAAKHEIGSGKIEKEDSKHHVEKENKKDGIN